MWRSRRQNALPMAQRQRQHMVRYLGAGQTRFGTKKGHLSHSQLRWRFYLTLLLAAIIALGVMGLVREIR